MNRIHQNLKKLLILLSRFEGRTPTAAASEDDRRLVAAGVPVLLLFVLGMGMWSSAYLNPLNSVFRAVKPRERYISRIYPVLVKQADQAKVKRDEIRALSDVSAGGSGGITAQYGFHSLSNRDNLSLPAKAARAAREVFSVKVHSKNGSAAQLQPKTKGAASSTTKGNRFRVPSNYRFRQDFLLRFDGASLLSIARQKLAGFAYFRQMLKQIREGFAPPGVNYMFRDQAGYVINQPIKPQVVQVVFALDPEGNVSDVRKLSSIGQVLVDEACLNALRGQNFGRPPPEIFKKGNVFGINFVFPALKR